MGLDDNPSIVGRLGASEDFAQGGFRHGQIAVPCVGNRRPRLSQLLETFAFRRRLRIETAPSHHHPQRAAGSGSRIADVASVRAEHRLGVEEAAGGQFE